MKTKWMSIEYNTDFQMYKHLVESNKKKHNHIERNMTMSCSIHTTNTSLSILMITQAISIHSLCIEPQNVFYCWFTFISNDDVIITNEMKMEKVREERASERVIEKRTEHLLSIVLNLNSTPLILINIVVDQSLNVVWSSCYQ